MKLTNRKYYIIALITILIITTSTILESYLSAGNIKRFEVGILVQTKIVENQSKMNRMLKEIEQIKRENEQLLINILKSNNIELKGNEKVNLDVDKWILTFIEE